MIGTLINTATVLAGASVGLLIQSRLPEKYIQIVFQALGLFTIVLGVQMALTTGNPLVLVLSLILGGITGELLQLEQGLNKLVSKYSGERKGSFQEGFVTGFMVFCIGSLTILGCIQEGLTGKRDLLLTKSIMDLFSSLALASALGRGVLFSAIPLLIYQGAITFGAKSLQDVLDGPAREELIATGGVILIGLGIQLLDIKKFRIVNLIPSLVFAVALTYLFLRLGYYSF